MHDFRRKVALREQFAGRVSQWVEFKPASLEDARVLADKVCEVQVADDLLEYLHQQTAGSMRGMMVGLSKIETIGKRVKGPVTRQHWGDRAFTLTNEVE
jgi:hypothetical protein